MMKLDSGLYLHDSDKAAMVALKAIPGFSFIHKNLVAMIVIRL